MVSAGDAAIQQFDRALDSEAVEESFRLYDVADTRVDKFLYLGFHKKYPHLWTIIHKVLLLSHGQATVERGYSVNKEVETPNMEEGTVEAHRLICDALQKCGGVQAVPITKGLLNSAATARSKYRTYLEESRQQKLSQERGQKRKALEEEVQNLRKRQKTIETVRDKLESAADRLAEEAESANGNKMCELITKSVGMRKKFHEKRELVKQLSDEIKDKLQELKHA